MSKSYYDLLSVEPSATADEIKRAFRREIAKYHPDKVQHLGQEFQDIAASKAAELTLAYKTLTDAAARAEYDAQLGAKPAEPPAAPSQPPAPPVTEPAPEPSKAEPRPPEPAAGGGTFAADRAGALDLIRRATVARFLQALEGEFGSYEMPATQGFEISCNPRPVIWKLKQPPRVLGRFVPRVDGAALSESWTLALRSRPDDKRELCVFVMGPAVAPARELAEVITEQRRKPAPAGGKLVLVPVNTQTWAAHVPTDAPPVVKSLLSRLKAF
ncbi:MAG TPA: J domain-containing protein [Vicinamibacterales bacterium]|nr:J domain-containing protein [Vicinamibacterales bacterium]